MIITAASIVSWSETAINATIDDQTVLMDMAGGKFIGLDQVGTAVWNRIKEPVSVSDVSASCAEAFEGDPAVIEADIIHLLTVLAGHRLVRIAS